ncbi:hypothetical protein DMUE_5053 [Dictyocoela muelleri]|nr:hypothetical protein DMUE_5053 [Dictyocoela muelleri]
MFQFRQKYHRGRIYQENRLIFGIADTAFKPAKYYVEVVPNLRRKILLLIIERICRPGTIIWSDEWPSYNNLSLNFHHETVNHSINFINFDNGANTQTIESLGRKLKTRQKSIMGVGKLDIQDNLNEWMWKESVSEANFNNFIKFIGLK